MTIEIVPHGTERKEATLAFNKRMREGGSRWGFYVDPECNWIPPREGKTVWREFYLAVEDGDIVRGGYALKPQQWLINGELHTVADWQGPFSEGAYDNKYNTLGLRMVRDMLKKQPLLYSWGHGSDDEPMVQMLRKMSWLMYNTPLCIRVYRPSRFLRLNNYLRQTTKRRLLLDLLAYTGTAELGVRSLHAALRLRSGKRLRAKAEEVAKFGSWADQLWKNCKDHYSALAIRDAAVMNTLLPGSAWPPGIRLKISIADKIIGWAVVMDTQMQNDHRFGDCRVGSIVDCLAAPADSAEVVAAASRFLQQRSVDLVVSNQAHPAWLQGFADNGYIILKDKRIFAASPKLKALLTPIEQAGRGLHLTNMDGHGPMAL